MLEFRGCFGSGMILVIEFTFGLLMVGFHLKASRSSRRFTRQSLETDSQDSSARATSKTPTALRDGSVRHLELVSSIATSTHRYGLWEAIVPPGGGPPPHLHRNEEEGFYVIDGIITVYAEDREVQATPGSFVHLPRGSKHWFRNNEDSAAKMLILVAPGGMEGLFQQTGCPVTDIEAPIPAMDDEENSDSSKQHQNSESRFKLPIIDYRNGEHSGANSYANHQV